jgi:hypothetical protein
MAHWKVNEIRLCAMRNVDQTFCPKLLSEEQTFALLFSLNHSPKAINSLITQSACVYLDLLPRVKRMLTEI